MSQGGTWCCGRARPALLGLTGPRDGGDLSPDPRIAGVWTVVFPILHGDFQHLLPVPWYHMVSHVWQGSEKWGRWGRIFPDKAKSHGQFGPKTTYKTDRQTDTDRQSVIRYTERHKDRQLDRQTDIQVVRQI